MCTDDHWPNGVASRHGRQKRIWRSIFEPGTKSFRPGKPESTGTSPGHRSVFLDSLINMTGSSKPAIKSRTRDWTQHAASVTATKSIVTPADDTTVLNMDLDGHNDDGSQRNHESIASSLRADEMTAHVVRISIGRLSGNSKIRPDKSLVVVDTVVESCSIKSTGELMWQPVENTRLRRLVVNEWLKRELQDVSSQCIFTEIRGHDKVWAIVRAKDSGHAVTS